MRPILLVVALLATAPLLAQSAPQIPGQPDAARITAGTYATDPAHTLIGWRIDHLGFNDYFGIFGDATGTLTIDPKAPAAANVDITIPVGKLTTASAGLTKHMLTKDFLDAEAQPTARFVSTSVAVSGTTAQIAGTLTLLGVSKPVTLDARFRGAGKAPERAGGKETIGFEATTKIKRSDFGMMYALPAISDEVELDITVAFEKQ